jgi:hypothetical protein
MSLSLSAGASALSPGLSTYFLGAGGVEPYTYAVVPGGAGGAIDPGTGFYQAPAVMNPDPSLTSDMIEVTDDDLNTATLPILVTNPLGLFCEILQQELGLSQARSISGTKRSSNPTIPAFTSP